MEISFEVANHPKAPDEAEEMDGVYEYLPSETMTAEERARHRMPKRKHQLSSLQQAAQEESDNNEILMQGNNDVWPNDQDGGYFDAKEDSSIGKAGDYDDDPFGKMD